MATEAEKGLVSGILLGLSSGSPQQAWTDFLESYSALILQVVRLLESDPDDVANCFLFVCEQLSRKRFHRLRHFRADGPASFSTWLRAVTRNLSVDWYRSQHGRPQIFDSIAGLDALKQEIFQRVHQDGMSPDEAFAHMRARIPELTRQQFNQSIHAIERALTPRQRWLLSTRKQRFEPLEAEVCDGSSSSGVEIQDPQPGPEELATRREQQASLRRSLASLPSADRLILRLRFEQELTLDQVARLSGLPDPQTADRRIRKILDRLRMQFGKSKAASVQDH